LKIVGDFTEEERAIRVARRLNSNHVIDVLVWRMIHSTKALPA
jgi:hypothetical protein